MSARPTRSLSAASVVLWSAILACSQAATAADNSARTIMEEAQRRTESESERYEGILRSTEKSGKTSEKRWTYERLGSHGGAKSVIRFIAPAEVKGVALLVVNHVDRASDQWMWTPALERDRRIATQDRGTRFFGTDFSFEDLEERDVDQFTYELLDDDVVAGAPCWRIEATPRNTKASQYTRSIFWIRKDHHLTARIESYVKESLVRRLDYEDVRQIQGIWTALRLSMTDVKRGSTTVLSLTKVEYNVPLAEDRFSLQALRQ